MVTKFQKKDAKVLSTGQLPKIFTFHCDSEKNIQETGKDEARETNLSIVVGVID